MQIAVASGKEGTGKTAPANQFGLCCGILRADGHVGGL